MLLFKTAEALKSHLSPLYEKGQIGLVPTMGALHRGHMALVERAVRNNDHVVVSIFVNPTQFDDKNDLDNYPQTLNADMKLLEDVSKSIMIFAPTAAEVYQNNITAKAYDFEGLDRVMEGAFRADHFNGVGTIVETLLRLVAPNTAYFGEKDYQQLQIIKKMVASQNLPVTIIGCPIVREASGLAMSSRNERLSKAMRKDAAFIYKTLLAAKKIFGTKSAKNTVQWVSEQFQEHPALDLEYIEISNSETLTPVLKKQQNRKYRAFVAVYAEDVRLIDNIALN